MGVVVGEVLYDDNDASMTQISKPPLLTAGRVRLKNFLPPDPASCITSTSSRPALTFRGDVVSEFGVFDSLQVPVFLHQVLPAKQPRVNHS